MRYRVDLEFNIPDYVSKEQFEEWFKYKIAWGGCYVSNPLIDNDISDLVNDYYLRECN